MKLSEDCQQKLPEELKRLQESTADWLCEFLREHNSGTLAKLRRRETVTDAHNLQSVVHITI